MRQQNMWRLTRADYLKLVPILALAFYLAFIPHLDYPYPVHIDEWVHLTQSKAMLQAQDTTYLNPFSGQSTVGIGSNLEAGFHLFWGVFHQISGIPWLTIFRYFPSIIFIITVLSVYILAWRQGFGWEAALFTCLVPTTVGIMGPAFLVPLATGLIFIALSLFIVFNYGNKWSSYAVLFIFTCFLLAMHAPTAVGLVIVFIPYILLNLKGNFRTSLAITLSLSMPFLLVFPWIFDMLLPAAKSLLVQTPPSPYVDIPRVIQTYGYIPVLSCLVGTLILAVRGKKEDYSLVLGLIALLLMLVIFWKFHYGLHIMYHRGLVYMMLMMSVVAGAGLMGVKKLRLPEKMNVRLGKPVIAKSVGPILCLALIGIILAQTIPQRQAIPYYHMIDEADYNAFVWIRDNVSEDYDKAILDPWKATAFAAVTGKYVYTRTHMAPKDKDREANKFLRGGSTDSEFLRENGISIVYTSVQSQNPDLTEVRKNVYLLQEAGNQ